MVNDQEGRREPKRGVHAEDLLRILFVRDPQVSPCEKKILYVVKRINEEREYQSNLAVYDVERGETLYWTHGKGTDHHPRWSADGKWVAFMSKRSGKMQVWLLPSSGGEARQLTRFFSGVDSFQWAPDGESIIVLCSQKSDDPLYETKEKKEEEMPKPLVVERLKYKSDGSGFFEGERQSLYIVSIDSGKEERLTHGDEGISSMRFSPDGKWLAYTAKRGEDPDRTFTNDLYLLDLKTRAERKLTDGKGLFGSLSWSPKGDTLAAVGHFYEYAGATLPKVWLFHLPEGELQPLTASWDVAVEDVMTGDIHSDAPSAGLIWDADGEGLHFLASVKGNVNLFHVSLKGEITPVLEGDFHIYGASFAPKEGRWYLMISDPVKVGDLYSFSADTGALTRLTQMNRELESEAVFLQPEAFSYKAKDGWDLHGWILKPIDFKPERKVPLILEIHGGPHAMYGNTFFHELQLLAAQGYGVLYLNPRGSHGYGQAFVNAVRGDYGGMDFEDLMAGLDEALQRFPWIDASRLGVTGGSYGGFMTNWIVGHTNRFKAAVTQRSISNWLSFYGVSDIGYFFTEWEVGSHLWENPERLWHHSPLRYVKQVETPLLILHSEKDYRCPIEQGEQLYVALKHLNKEVRFVRFPDSNHNLSRTGKPDLRISRLTEILQWFSRYI